MAVAENKTQKLRNGLANFEMYSVFIIYELSLAQAVLHGSSTTWFQTLRYCRAKVEFNSINLVRHSCRTTFETGLRCKQQ